MYAQKISCLNTNSVSYYVTVFGWFSYNSYCHVIKTKAVSVLWEAMIRGLSMLLNECIIAYSECCQFHKGIPKTMIEIINEFKLWCLYYNTYRNT